MVDCQLLCFAARVETSLHDAGHLGMNGERVILSSNSTNVLARITHTTTRLLLLLASRMN